MASGRPTVPLRSIFQQAPDFFLRDVEATDKREVVLPFNKVLEQFTAFQVRSDQMTSDSVPQLETPFLKMTIEDGQRFGTPATPVPSPRLRFVIERTCACGRPGARPARDDTATPSSRAGSPQPIGPIRLPLPSEVEIPRRRRPGPKSIALEQPPARPPRAARISPNGMGVPAAERVPASSGPPVPTSLPSPLPPPPARIPLKVSPPSRRSAQDGQCLRPPVTAGRDCVFGRWATSMRLPLRSVLRGFLPFQLSGPIDDVPETAAIEIPFSIIEPQLSLGRIAVSPRNSRPRCRRNTARF